MIDVPVQVKDALKEGAYKKNYRFVVLNDDDTEDFTIDNENLVSESVGIDERMCSGDVIKFGLCEGSSLEFQYFGKQNITGREIQAFVDVDYEAYGTSYHNIDHLTDLGQFTIETAGEYRVFSPSNDFSDVDIIRSGAVIPATVTTEERGTYADMQCEEGDVIQFTWVSGENIDTYLQSVVTGVQIFTYPIPMGFFTVKNCSRQASTGIIKATAYNKLMSDYLDQKANLTIDDLFSEDESLILFDIKYALLKNYQIEPNMTQITPSLPQDGQIISTWSEMAVDKSLYFQSDYGCDSPFNYYEWVHDAGDRDAHVMFLYLAYHQYSFTRESINDFILFKYTKGDLETFEQNVFNTLYKYIDNAKFATSNHGSTLITASELMDYILENNYWLRFCGVIVGSENYSTLTYNYRKAHGLDVTHYHPIGEVLYRTFKDNAYFNCPAIIGLVDNVYTSQRNYFYFRPIDGNIHPDLFSDVYTFYIDSAQHTQTKRLDHIYYSTGEMYDDSNDDGGQEDLLVYMIADNDLPPADKVPVTISTLPEFTLRDIVSATYETVCQYGQLSRETDLFSGVELNHSRLLPQETLYPANDLYPGGAQTSATKAMYSKLWADEGNVHKWRYLIITFKGLDEEQKEKEFTLQRTINADGTDDYNCSDNWLFKNLVWTAEQIGAYADAMVLKMQDITWFPFEMWCAGLPYVETGDEIEIPLGQQSYTSYVLQRQLKGIQNLQDTYINGTLDIF